jgi:hypothetical protein
MRCRSLATIEQVRNEIMKICEKFLAMCSNICKRINSMQPTQNLRMCSRRIRLQIRCGHVGIVFKREFGWKLRVGFYLNRFKKHIIRSFRCHRQTASSIVDVVSIARRRPSIDVEIIWNSGSFLDNFYGNLSWLIHFWTENCTSRTGCIRPNAQTIIIWRHTRTVCARIYVDRFELSISKNILSSILFGWIIILLLF